MKIFVIGAGVSSLAFCSFLEGQDINVIEKNEYPGKKLLATGNGRCNFTNLNLSIDNYFSKEKDFADFAIKNFGNNSLTNYFSSLGLEWTSLESGRCYPKTMSSKSVRDMLFLKAKENANFIFNEEVLDIDFDKKLLISRNRRIPYDILVIASGGITLKNSGSDGKILKILEKRTEIEDPTYGITNFSSKDRLSKTAKGTKIKGRASLFVDDEFVISSIDDIIFQDYGLTGTAILDISNKTSLALKEDKNVRIDIDFYPEYLEKELSDKLFKKFKVFPNLKLQELLIGFVHDKLIFDIIKRSKIDLGKIVNRKVLNEISHTLKNLSFNIEKIHDKENAQITIGGVSSFKIDKKTMRSKDIDNVYFIGEVMDVAGVCGGYNIQWAFSSAKLCADDIRRLDV